MGVYRRVAVTSPCFGIDSDLTDNSSRMSVLTDLSPLSGSMDSTGSISSLDSPGFDSPGRALWGSVQIRTVLESDFVVAHGEVETLLATPLTWESGRKGADIESMLLSEAIKKINSKNNVEQVAGIKALRGRDSKYSETQGYILVPHLREMQRAIVEMKAVLSSCDAVFGIDRGGGMIVSYLKAVEDEGSTQHLQRIPKTQGDVRSAILGSIRTVLDSFCSSCLDKDGPIKVGFVETFISGSSVNTLTTALLQLNKEYSDVEFQVVALRQTKGVLKPCKLEKGIPVHQVSVPYLLAEDVGYQLAEKPETGCKPVIVLDINEELIPTSVCSLNPVGDVVARDLVVALVAGKLNM